jgi:hypothetical protein
MRLLADIVIPGQPFGIGSERSDAVEAFVIFTLGTLFGVLLMFALAGWVLWRRHQYPEPHRQLLIELEDDAPREPLATGDNAAPKPQPKPWERSEDWWKQ